MPHDAARRNRRHYYRVVYPAFCRPLFFTHGASALVLDCSEMGLRLLVPRGSSLDVKLGDGISGFVQFHDRVHHPVAGVVVRYAPPMVAIHLTERGLAFPTIVDEQRWLRRWYRFELEEG